jgi:hypothetical protein
MRRAKSACHGQLVRAGGRLIRQADNDLIVLPRHDWQRLTIERHDAWGRTKIAAVDRERLLLGIERRSANGQLLRRRLPLRVQRMRSHCDEDKYENRQIGDAGHPVLLGGAVDRSDCGDSRGVNRKRGESRIESSRTAQPTAMASRSTMKRWA